MTTSTLHEVDHGAKTRGAGRHDPYRWHAYGVAGLFVLTLPTILAIVAIASPEPPVLRWSAEAAALGVDRDIIVRGESTFLRACALCHGQDAQGVARLGKPLRNSAFVQGHTDSDLFTVITRGRLPTDPENTTGVVMPARAGQGLTDDQVGLVVAFLRAIQEPDQPAASMDAWIASSSGGGSQASELVSGEGGIGKSLFVSSCSSCHGQGGEGMQGLGKPLASSDFVGAKTDEELIAFVKAGRPIWDAENTTGVDMPPKGGNPALTEEQLLDIVQYIRSIHK